MKQRLVYKIINIVLFTFVLFFILRFLYKNLFVLTDFNFKIKIGLFLLSIITVWVWLSISIIGFHLLIKKIVPRLNFIDNAKIWSSSYLGLYIPGKVGVIALRISHYNKLGVSAAKVGYSFIIEIVLSVLSAVFVLLFSSIFLDLPYINHNLYAVCILLLLLLSAIHPRLISFYTRLYYKYIKKTEQIHTTPYNYFFYLKIISLNLLKWVFVGLGIFLLINSATELSPKYIPFVTGLYALAAISGMLAVFAPSGLGVLEGIMIIGLKTILSKPLAGLISILVRLWKILGELSFVLLVKILLWLVSKRRIKAYIK